LAHASAKGLCDLYVWTDRVVRLALELAQEDGALRPGTPDAAGSRGTASTSASDYAQEVSSLLEEIAEAPSNGEFISKIAQSNARLFRARTVEWNVLGEVQEELSQLVLPWRARQLSDLSARIRHYHLRRIDRCEEIAEALKDV
jgi:hypothetical protein